MAIMARAVRIPCPISERKAVKVIWPALVDFEMDIWLKFGEGDGRGCWIQCSGGWWEYLLVVEGWCLWQRERPLHLMVRCCSQGASCQ